MFDVEKPDISSCMDSNPNCPFRVHKTEFTFYCGNKTMVYCKCSLRERLEHCPRWNRELYEKAGCTLNIVPIGRFEYDYEEEVLTDNFTNKTYHILFDGECEAECFIEMLNKEFEDD